MRGRHYSTAARRRPGRWAALVGLATLAAVTALLVALPRPSAPPAAPGGVVRAGDSKTGCIYVGGSSVQPQLARAEQAAGVRWSCLETFSDADPTWAGWTRPWITSPSSGIPQWLAAGKGRRSLVVSDDLIPLSVADPARPLSWELPCAAGAYDGYARQFARALVGAGEGRAVVRLGKEMNGDWEPDFVGTTLTEQHAWAGCFAREVAAMRSVPGAHLLFDWNPNACTRAIPLARFYPGNASVDLVGLDLYDVDCAQPLPTTPSPQGWHQLSSEPLGLVALTRFATAHHKAMSLPEWGLPVQAPGGGADPFYVEGIARYVATHEVAFESYFDSAGNGIRPLGPDNPAALAAYQRGFGPSGEVANALRARAK